MSDSPILQTDGKRPLEESDDSDLLKSPLKRLRLDPGDSDQEERYSDVNLLKVPTAWCSYMDSDDTDLEEEEEEEAAIVTKPDGDGGFKGYHRWPCYCNYSDYWRYGDDDRLDSLGDYSACKGDTVNTRAVLFTKYRNYLIKNDGDKVRYSYMEGKYVGLYFVLVDGRQSNPAPFITRHLIDTYHELQPKGNFEIVLVANVSKSYSFDMGKKEGELFNNLFSTMPWTAIPYADEETRSHLSSLFFNCCTIMDPNGKIVYQGDGNIFNLYGADAFPFTAEKIQFLESEQKKSSKYDSLSQLLASHDRDFVISSKGEKIPILHLENKVIGILFYYKQLCPSLLEKLKKSYHDLKEHGEFEIVMVYLHFTFQDEDENLFNKFFETVPWLSLPFKDSYCRRLRRICGYPDQAHPGYKGILSIIGPGGSYLEYYGIHLLDSYGIEVYPFTPQKALKVQMKQIKEAWKLELALSPGSHLFGMDGRKVLVSELLEMKVFLFFGTNSCHRSGKFLSILETLYSAKKGTDDEFEVVYMSLDCQKSSFDESISEMPWLVHPFCKKKTNECMTWLFGHPAVFPALAAFDHGVIVERESHVAFKNECLPVYPFINMMETEIFYDILVSIFRKDPAVAFEMSRRYHQSNANLESIEDLLLKAAPKPFSKGLQLCSTITSAKRLGEDAQFARRYSKKLKSDEVEVLIYWKSKPGRSYHQWPCYCNDLPLKYPEVDDYIDLRVLLFTEGRDYLVRNNGQKVSFVDLEGKYIVLYFHGLKAVERDPYVTRDLLEAYKDLWPKGRFEVVFIACGRFNEDDPKKRFEDLFSQMPWPAIPFDDFDSRYLLERCFGLFEEQDSPPRPAQPVLVGPDGHILQHHAAELLSFFGADAFPFTPEKIKELRMQVGSLCGSFTQLLGSSDRDYVISSRRDKVQINDLENKVVGIFFYSNGFPHDLLEKLKIWYGELKDQNFEIILVFMHNTFHPSTAKKHFDQMCEDMPWLALPYEDPIYRRLRRNCGCPDYFREKDWFYWKGISSYENVLTICSPRTGTRYYEYFGLDLLLRYGVDVYPFSRKHLANTEIKRLKEVTRELIQSPEFLSLWSVDFKLKVSVLMEERVIILFATKACCNKAFASNLDGRKCWSKPFEVVYLPLDCIACNYVHMPWFVCPNKGFGLKWMKKFFGDPDLIPAIVAFEKGQLVGMRYDKDEGLARVDFPFCGDLEEEVLKFLEETLDLW